VVLTKGSIIVTWNEDFGIGYTRYEKLFGNPNSFFAYRLSQEQYFKSMSSHKPSRGNGREAGTVGLFLG